jgi:ABC-2 type transport system permease protein
MEDATSAEAVHQGLANAPTRVMSARVKLGTRLLNLRDRRELLRNLIISDIRIKYKGSALGLLWSMLNPAFTLGIYYLVFSVVLKNGYPNYVIFLFSGLIVWNLFQNAVFSATGVIVDRAGLVKKVSFPREILPLASVGSAVIYFLIQLVVLIIFLFIFHHAPDWNMLAILPITFANLYLFAASVSIVMAAFTVYMRDMKHLMEVLLQLWFWMSPVVYSYSNSLAVQLATHHLKWFYFMNPMALLVLTFQRTFYVNTLVHLTTGTHALTHMLPSWAPSSFLYLNSAMLVIMVGLFLLALTIFGRLEGNFESEL